MADPVPGQRLADIPAHSLGHSPEDDHDPIPGPIPEDDPVDTTSLTYSELAAALGITPASAKKLAARRGWPRTIGNDGLARVNVPVERLSIPAHSPEDSPGDGDVDSPTDDHRDSPEDIPAPTRALIAHLEAAAADLRARLDKAENELAGLRPLAAELAQARAQVDAERRRAEDAAAAAAALVAAERGRADAEARRAADMAAHAAALLEAEKARAEELRAALEAARARRWFQIFRRP